MKKVFSVLAVAALILVSFSSCDPQEKTYTDLLTNSKGWVLSSAKSTPAYENSLGVLIEDIYNEAGYFYGQYEKDYILVFNADGTMIVKPGKTAATAEEIEDNPDAYVAATNLGSWHFDNPENPRFIYMQVPYFYDETVEICEVLELTKDNLRIRCTFNDDDPQPTKGTYTFTLGFELAK